jgi:hypothetical protein
MSDIVKRNGRYATKGDIMRNSKEFAGEGGLLGSESKRAILGGGKFKNQEFNYVPQAGLNAAGGRANGIPAKINRSTVLL